MPPPPLSCRCDGLRVPSATAAPRHPWKPPRSNSRSREAATLWARSADSQSRASRFPPRSCAAPFALARVLGCVETCEAPGSRRTMRERVGTSAGCATPRAGDASPVECRGTFSAGLLSSATSLSMGVAIRSALRTRRRLPRGRVRLSMALVRRRRIRAAAARALRVALGRRGPRTGRRRVARDGSGRATTRPPGGGPVPQRWLRSSFRIASSALMISARSTRDFAKLSFRLKDFVVGR